MTWRREGVASSSAGSGAVVGIAATNGTFEATKVHIRNTSASFILYVGINDPSLTAARAAYTLGVGSAHIEVDLAPGDTLHFLGNSGVTNTTFIYNRMRLK